MLYKKITLPYQILFIIMMTFLMSFYFSTPHLDKNTAAGINKCEISNNNSNFYQTGEFNLKNNNSCQQPPQWPMLPKES